MRGIRKFGGILLLGASPLLGGCSGIATQEVASTSTHQVGEADMTAIDVASYQDGQDPLFANAYIDIDELRDAPVRHRYVHGGFTGTDTKFSFYFPPAERFEGRFFHHVTPVPISENLGQQMPAGSFNKIGFAADSGAYFVETNGGGMIDIAGGANQADPTITAFRANAAAARLSRFVAQQVYATDARPYGYIYGGSGGAYRTVGGLESTDAWDGGVPYVPGSNMAIPNMFTVRMQAMRVLGDKLADVTDAVDPGGSGKPYAGLNEQETMALREVDRMGFPLKSFYGYKTMGIHGFAALYPAVAMVDPTYFTEFWTKPGYLGHDRPDHFADARMQHESKVASIVTAGNAAELGLNLDVAGGGDEADKDEEEAGNVDNAFEYVLGDKAARIVGYRLAQTPPDIDIVGADLRVNDGDSEGRTMPVARIVGDIVLLGFADEQAAAGIKPGDTVTVDNSNFLAMESYHRHQVPGPDFPTWDQFRDAEGKPLYPQRPMVIGPIFTQNTTGSGMTGKVDEKVIILSSLWDREAMPWQADWYRKRVEAYAGEQAHDRVRLYYTDHALHGDQPGEDDATRIVSYNGPLQQALRLLSAWVEDGVAPPESTQYRIEDGQVLVSDDAGERLGIQPVVTLSAGGEDGVTIAAGDSVSFSGTIAAPPGGGSVIAAAWDFDNSGEFDQAAAIPAGQPVVSVEATHRFDTPGTYFAVLRGTTQPDGDASSPYALLTNLARVRVVVK